MAKKANIGNLFSAILYILLGVVLVAFPGRALKWGMLVAGAFFLISGILDLVKKNFAGGLVSVLFGIIILVLGSLVLDIGLLVLGILIALKGIVDLINELKARRVTVLGILFPIITFIIGCALAFGNGFGWLILVVGIFLIVYGVLGLIACVTKK